MDRLKVSYAIEPTVKLSSYAIEPTVKLRQKGLLKRKKYNTHPGIEPWTTGTLGQCATTVLQLLATHLPYVSIL